MTSVKNSYLLNNTGENTFFLRMHFIKCRNEAAFTPSKKCKFQKYPELLSRWKNSSREAGFTLVEVLLALTLLSLLFALANGALFSMGRISGKTIASMQKARALEFCAETMRKELGEARCDPADDRFQLTGGEGFLSYSTTRSEVIARTDMPRGFLQVEWKFDPDKKTLQRTVTDLVQRGKEIGKTASSTLLDGLIRVSFEMHDGKQWTLLRGKPTVLPVTQAIAVELEFDKGQSPFSTPIYKSAFAMPR